MQEKQSPKFHFIKQTQNKADIEILKQKICLNFPEDPKSQTYQCWPEGSKITWFDYPQSSPYTEVGIWMGKQRKAGKAGTQGIHIHVPWRPQNTWELRMCYGGGPCPWELYYLRNVPVWWLVMGVQVRESSMNEFCNSATTFCSPKTRYHPYSGTEVMSTGSGVKQPTLNPSSVIY